MMRNCVFIQQHEKMVVLSSTCLLNTTSSRQGFGLFIDLLHKSHCILLVFPFPFPRPPQVCETVISRIWSKRHAA